MSLLIKALEQAAKDRKAGRVEPLPAGPPDERNHAASPATAEPTLEPLPPSRPALRAQSDIPPPRSAPQLSLDVPWTPPASAGESGARSATAGAASANASPSPPPRRAPSSLASLASSDAQHERARAAAVVQAGGSSAGYAIAWLRANPVMMVGALAVMAGVAFGLYVYLQVAHPGMFVRQAAITPPPPAAPLPPAATPPPAPAMPETSAASSTVSPAPALDALPSGATAPGFPSAGSSGSIAPGPLPPTVASMGTPSQGPLSSASVIGPGSGPETSRRQVAEGGSALMRERESMRAPDVDPPLAPSIRTTRPAADPDTAPVPTIRTGRTPVQSVPDSARQPVNVTATANQPRLNPALSQAYSQLQSGNIEEARALYNKANQAEPLNIDALLGLAYVAAQDNRADEATRHYLRILSLNPRHAVAQGALIGLMGRADPSASESRLKQLIAREPSPFLHFVLGNLYADQAQWSQAQQSYFQAHHLEPENPDYAYNLAVGLDHLRQNKLALNFYRRADQLASAKGRSNFNLSHARERIGILSSQVD